MLAAAVGGCEDGKFGLTSPSSGPAATKPDRAERPVPEPIHLLLPQGIRIHPFSGMRTFDQTGGLRGIDVRIEAIDAYDDSTKAFGKFLFALHRFRPGTPNPRGQRVATWEEDLLDPRKNVRHWDSITRVYKFRLRWDRAIPVGSRFLLTATFSSPFTRRKYAERDFVAGE